MSAVKERVDETAACVMKSLLLMSNNLSEDRSMDTKSSNTVSSMPMHRIIALHFTSQNFCK